MEAIPSHLRSTLEEINRFESVLTEASLNKQERLQYERSLRYYRDEMATIAFYKQEGLEEGRAEGREEGRAEGRAEGREEGRDEERKKIAANLKAMGLSVDDIAKASGLSVEEASAL